MSQQDSLTQDTVYDLLSNARRRFVLSYLRERDDPIELSELSERVAAWENDTEVDQLSDQQIKRVYVSLYQTHIPKLDDSGLVDYNKDTGLVQLTSNVSELDTYLPEEREEAVPWALVYAGVAAVGLAVYGARMLFPVALAGISMTALNITIIAAFAVIAVAHYWSRTRQ